MDGILPRYLWSHGFYRSNDSIQNERRIERDKMAKRIVDVQAKFPDWNKRDDIKSALFKVGF